MCDAGWFCHEGTTQHDAGMCSRVAVCDSTNGVLPVLAPCVCGTVTCDAVTGMYCQSSHSACSSVKRCGNTNGTVENAGVDSCSCGSTTCDSSTGFFCDAVTDARGGHGQCSRMSNVWYEEVRSGTCADLPNRRNLLTSSECSAAMHAVGRPITALHLHINSAPHQPGGVPCRLLLLLLSDFIEGTVAPRWTRTLRPASIQLLPPQIAHPTIHAYA